MRWERWSVNLLARAKRVSKADHFFSSLAFLLEARELIVLKQDGHLVNLSVTFGRHLTGSRMVRHDDILSREHFLMMTLCVRKGLSLWHDGSETVCRRLLIVCTSCSQDQRILAFIVGPSMSTPWILLVCFAVDNHFISFYSEYNHKLH